MGRRPAPTIAGIASDGIRLIGIRETRRRAMTIQAEDSNVAHLLKRGAVAAGAAALATTRRSSEIVAARRAPALVRHYRQSDKLTVLYMQSGTYDEAARAARPSSRRRPAPRSRWSPSPTRTSTTTPPTTS